MNRNKQILRVITVGIIGYAILKRLNTTKRRWWVRPWLQRRNDGRGILNMIHNELKNEDKDNFRNFLRMNESSFLRLLNILQVEIERRDTQLRQSISAENRLSITLRFLATGESFKSLSFSTRIAQNTLSQIIPQVLLAIVKTMREKYLSVPVQQEEWQQVANDFFIQWNFPNCLGALDGKHVSFRPPRSAGSFYRNYKGSDSIVLLALVSANYKFLYTDIGVNGRISDGGVFARSEFSSALTNNSLRFPQNKPLPGRELSVPFVIVADDAFPLKEMIMKPYRYRGLTNEQKIYNYRLSRARRVVENAFGILANRFRILLNPINLCVEKVELITTVCCILHNFLLENSKEHYLGVTNEDITACSLTSLSQQGGNRSGNTALRVREEFQAYFNTNGAVEWQQRSVNNNQL